MFIRSLVNFRDTHRIAFATLKMLSSFALLSLLTGLVSAQQFPDCVSGPLVNNSVCDTTLSSYARATALVSLFTLAEKINNTQDASPGVPRLGLPAYEWWNEALHGIAGSPGVKFAAAGADFSYATSFPQPILMGASFDDDLIRDVATVVSTEARAFNNVGRSGLDYWTPNINPYKDPRWGRGQETPGEDPFHVSQYVAHLITGLQGDPSAPYLKVAATCKHYAGYDMEYWNGNARYSFDAIISTQDMRDYYLPPFQQCARDSNVQSVMCSYNAVNGVPTCADPYLLQTVLREYWGWDSDDTRYVVSDCDAVQNIFNGTSWNVPSLGHNYTATPEEAVAAALIAGTDLNCGNFYAEFLQSAYDQNLYNISTLDRSLIRRYAALVKLGYFDSAANQPFRQLSFSNVSTSDSQALALRAAEEGIVLLKNDGLLPISTATKMVALIGPLANATMQMQGNYQGVAPYLHSPLEAANAAGFQVTYVQGTDVSNGTSGVPDAMAAAKMADIVIYVGGIDITVEAESLDRYDISWPMNQLSLISQLSAVSKKLVVVQMGTQLDSTLLVANAGVNSLVWAGYPGQDGGTAIFNILTGKTAPAGRLPVTQYPAAYVNQVPMTNMSLRAYESENYNTNNPGRTYKHYTGTPVFPFGFGLHYTNFSVSMPPPTTTMYNISSLLSSSAQPNGTKFSDQQTFATLPVTVQNTGDVASPYVLLAFLSGAFGPMPYTLKSLVGYQRATSIEGGQSAMMEIQLTLGNLARADENGNMVLWPGQYSVAFDVDGAAAWNFTLVGNEMALDAWPAPPKAGNSTS